MKKSIFRVTAVILMVFWAVLPGAAAQEVSGNSYYTITLDVSTAAVQHFTLSFTGDSSGDADNATGETQPEDNATDGLGGTVDIAVENKIFDNATGSFISRGPFYNGAWEGSEGSYSSYYQETIFTYYSYLFFGIVYFNDTFVAGMIYSTVTEESASKGKVVQSGLVPFWGVLVSRSSKLNVQHSTLNFERPFF